MSYESKMSNPATGRMFDELAQLIRDSIEIPNAMLPERFRDGRVVYGGRSLQELEDMIFEEENTESEYRRIKRLKAENIANYRHEVETLGEFSYSGHVDELEQYKKEMRFVAAGLQNGMIEEFDELS
jgi:hypothetical protein